MGRQKSYCREDLLEKAMMLFWEKGYSKTSMADLALATGVDKKCLFREFLNKETLFEEVLELYTAWDYQHFETLFNTKPLGLSNIIKFLHGMTVDHGGRGCLLNKSIVQRNLITTKHFAIIKKTITHLEASFLKNLKAAKKNGELKNNSTIEELAKYLVYSTQGISTMSLYESVEGNVDKVVKSIIASL
ncbi:MAG: TetR/AcrR family transcriptional regulator [Thiohalomonadales bacterium]